MRTNGSIQQWPHLPQDEDEEDSNEHEVVASSSEVAVVGGQRDPAVALLLWWRTVQLLLHGQDMNPSSSLVGSFHFRIQKNYLTIPSKLQLVVSKLNDHSPPPPPPPTFSSSCLLLSASTAECRDSMEGAE